MNNSDLSNTEVIPPRAGTLRGVRIWPDPDGILLSPFTEQGSQLGYVLIYGDAAPAVFDGKVWHPIMSEDTPWEEAQYLIVKQYQKIAQQAETNPAYKSLADRLLAAVRPAS